MNFKSNPAVRYLLFIALVGIAIFAVSEMSSNVAADTHTTQATGNANAAGTWDAGVPDAGDNLIFTGAYNIAMNDAKTYGNITLAALYSGTATQGSVNFGYSSFYILAGTWTGKVGQTQSCSGNWVQGGGTISDGVLSLIHSGTAYFQKSGSGGLTSYTVSGAITLKGSADPNLYSLIINIGNTLTIDTGRTAIFGCTSTSTFTNSGIINGPGTLKIKVLASSVVKTIALGDVRSILLFDNIAAIGPIFTLTGSSDQVSAVTILSSHATGTTSIVLSSGVISCTSMIVGVRGILSGSGVVSCSSNFDSYNGTTSGTWSLTMTGTSPWIKTPAANTINGLTWTGTNLRIASSLNVTKTFWVGGSYTLGTKTVTVGTATNVTVTLGNTWTVTATCYWGRLNVSGTLTAASPVSVWANSTCSVNGTVASTITLHVKQMTAFNGAVGDLYIEAAYRTHFYANGTWTAIYWNLTTTWNFHPKGLMPYTSPVYSKAQMRVLDPTNNAYYIEVIRFDTNVGFSIMVDGWAAETWEFTVTSTSATATLFTYNIVTPDVETEPVLIYLNGVYLDAKNMTLGSFSMNDVFNSTMGTRDYLIVCSDFGPTVPTTTFDYGIMGMCLVILSILTFASFRFQPLFIINGFAWIMVAVIIIEPVQATMALLCLGVGLIFAMWGAYRALLG